ncbi:RabGAP/TBC [Daedalea quercina L-15889]|uniref:RabGAP/TBC n=1 Tax=Daedalea quercina L-15889 TaxID=1314783 RepID=A0A165PQQ5_9APHY|nr:RabGAP/TBC [Daedalea quercina L-15889]
MKVCSPSPDPSESGLSVNAPSLRSKASSGLRVQTLGERPLLPSNERSPASSVFSFDNPTEQKVHVSVKDMDFELVAPSGPRSPVATSSADSLLIPGANVDAKSDASSLSLKRPLTAKSGGGDKVPKVTDAAEVEAHRQRELRWISALSSTTPSQARKTKRIRKLVLEGVPASVRYRVWAHLTDSEAKRMKGLYAQLDQRERVAAIANIEQDAQRIFRDQPLLDQSLVNVLQAYLTMVPDVQYTKGLAMIAGQLVLQSPEEDAFWTFVTLMDSHIRPYFSPQQALLEIDSSLFSKALESNDAALAHRIFDEMAITPIYICRPWFTALFAEAFPPDFLLRVWDVFLFEGVAFLFRVGLAIISSCRQSLMQCKSQEQLLALLAHPPLYCLPSTPDAFIDLAFTVKLRDDDIYKQRQKLEAQLKRQIQSRPQLSTSRVSTPTISLPRS